MFSSIYNIDFYTDKNLISQLPQFIWVLSTLKIEVHLIN